MKKNNLPYIVGPVILILLLLMGGVGLAMKGKGKSALVPTPTPKVNLIETPLEDRPFVTLTPDADAHQFTMKISRLKFGGSLEYEFSYSTLAGLSQGAIGTIELKGETNLTEKFLLGACSRNVCRYDEGVEKGTLVLRFRDQAGLRKFTTDFHLQKGVKELLSLDGNFKLSGKFPPNIYYLTMPTVGLPAPVSGEIINGPYGVFSAGTSGVKEGRLVFPKNDISGSKPMIWDNSSWQATGKELTTIGTFVLLKD